MKNFLSKNWKKIVYVLCGLAILINLIIVFTTPATMVDDYYKYGPQIKSNITSNITGISGEDIKDSAEEGVDSLTDYVAEESGMGDSTARVVVIAALLICGVLILSNLIDDGGSSGDKKKK